MNEITSKRGLNLNSRIFWRIAAVIFVSILLIEGALLLFSWFTERDRQFNRVEESLAAAVSLLDHSDPSTQLNEILVSPDNDSTLRLIGFFHKSVDGSKHSGGKYQGIEQYCNKDIRQHYIADNGELISYIESADGNHRYWFLTDATWIHDYMRNYVMRIIVMVMLISAFVTGACLIVLSPLLINPLQRLDQLLVRGEKMGIQSATSIESDLYRNDEVGRVFRSFELLRNRLLYSELENSRITDRFEGFANMGADCFWETDGHMRFNYIAGDVKRVLSLAAEDITGRTCDEVIADIQDRVSNFESLVHCLQDSGKWVGTLKASEPNAAPISVQIISEPLLSADGDVIGYRGTITDISKETALAEKLTYQATHDELTGLANRRELTQQVQLAITDYETNNTDFSLLILDLDRFKTINDSCGHTAGDMLINSVATRLEAAVRKNCTVARIGGDEFAVLLRVSDLEESQQIAENIRLMIEDFKFYWNGQPHSISASIGVAQAADGLDSHEALIFAADSCCLKAKQLGKNQVQMYSHTDETVSLFRDEALWISRILQALDNDDFVLFRQSIVPICTDNAEDHFEILIRMKDKDGGFWPPNLFLGAAERNNLMPKIDQWVVNNALEWLENQTISDDILFCMNINLSGASLSDTHFREFLYERVKQSQHLNRYVCYEVTETAAMISFDETIELLDGLRESGCQVALDDFGTGFSSLSHIKDLPLDYIKIDGAFIRNIVENELDQTVVSSVAEIARVLGIKTVAEFVDSDETLELLKSMKIDYAQGFLISKPEALIPIENQSDQANAA